MKIIRVNSCKECPYIKVTKPIYIGEKFKYECGCLHLSYRSNYDIKIEELNYLPDWCPLEDCEDLDEEEKDER